MATPSAGPPSLLFPTRGMFIHCFSCASLTEGGIPPQSYDHYVSTPEGANDVKTHGCTVYVPPGAIFYLPAGHIFTTLFYKPQLKKHKDEDEEFGTCTITPWPIKQKIDALSSNTKTALRKWHLDATKEKSAKMWKDRTAFLTEISVRRVVRARPSFVRGDRLGLGTNVAAAHMQ